MSPTGRKQTASRPDRPAAGNLWLAAAAHLALAFACSAVSAQDQRSAKYYPLDQTAPPGVVAQWSAVAHPDTAGYFQPVRIELPIEGRVTFFTRGAAFTTGLAAVPPRAAPAEAAMLIGPVYRIQISDMPDFPGVELYPSVELLDRLHPPAGRAAEFPIPIPFTVKEIQFALEGRLVTKVIYLEQPNRADPDRAAESAPSQILDPGENAIAAADHAGRPMALVRLGGRLPDADNREPEFYGAGAPLLLRGLAPASPPKTARKHPTNNK